MTATKKEKKKKTHISTTKMLKIEVTVAAQRIKCLPCEHADLSLDI